MLVFLLGVGGVFGVRAGVGVGGMIYGDAMSSGIRDPRFRGKSLLKS